MIETYCGDCLEIMPSLPEHSVDMILCDLPYGTTRNEWDSMIPLDRLWEQYRRLLKGGGVCALFAQCPFSYVLGASNLKDLRYDWIWRKALPTGFLNAKRAPLKAHESVLIFYQGSSIYNPQVTMKAPRKVGGKTTSSNYGHCNDVEQKLSTIAYPWDVLEWGSESEKLHPTQKPVGLCEYLIRTYTDEGMTVLDNCMGSGTTGVAAVQAGRSFIGIERDPEYYRIAVDRINAAERKERGRTTLEAFL